MVVGFLGGGVISDWIGYEWVLAIDSLSFLVSALFLTQIRWDTPVKRSAEVEMNKQRSWIRDLKEVNQYLWVRPMLLIVFLVYLVDTFGSGSHNLGIPLLAVQLDPARQAFFYGLIWGVWGAGNVITSYFLPKISWIQRNMQLACLISTILMSLGFISILSNKELVWILVSAFFIGIFDACAVTSYSVLMQQCDNEIRGRVLGVSTLMNRCGFGVGFIVAPTLLEHVTLPKMVWMMHGTIIITTIIALWIYVALSRKHAIKQSLPS